jgi:hypothetical protein
MDDFSEMVELLWNFRELYGILWKCWELFEEFGRTLAKGG